MLNIFSYLKKSSFLWASLLKLFVPRSCRPNLHPVALNKRNRSMIGSLFYEQACSSGDQIPRRSIASPRIRNAARRSTHRVQIRFPGTQQHALQRKHPAAVQCQLSCNCPAMPSASRHGTPTKLRSGGSCYWSGDILTARVMFGFHHIIFFKKLNIRIEY